MRMKLHGAHFGGSTGGLLIVGVLIISFLLEAYCTSQQQQQQQRGEGREPSSRPPPSSSFSPPPLSSSPSSSSSWSSPPPPPSSSWSSPPPSSSPSSSLPPPSSSPSWSSSRPPPSSPPPPPLSSSSSSLCINQLLPCLNYISGNGNENRNGGDSEPSDSCCDPLKEMIRSNPECLCNMISINGTNEAERAGIDVTQAQQLPARCGQRVNPISCLTSSGSPGSKDSVSNSASRFSFSSQIFAQMFTVLMISQAILSCTT